MRRYADRFDPPARNEAAFSRNNCMRIVESQGYRAKKRAFFDPLTMLLLGGGISNAFEELGIAELARGMSNASQRVPYGQQPAFYGSDMPQVGVSPLDQKARQAEIELQNAWRNFNSVLQKHVRDPQVGQAVATAISRAMSLASQQTQQQAQSAPKTR